MLMFFMLPSKGTDNINDFLDRYFSGYDSVDYEIVSMPKGVSELSGVTLLEDTDPTVKNGFMYIPVEVTHQNDKSVRSYITLKVKLYKEVAVAVQNINNRDGLEQTDFMIRKMDVAQLSSSAFTGIENINDYRARINIKEGEILQPYMLEKKPDVSINDPVEARILKGSVEITLDARAKEDGSIGDVIRILSSDKKYFQAKVETRKKVLIIE